MIGLDHVVLDIGSEPMLRPEERGQFRPRQGSDGVDHVEEVRIH